MSKHLVIVESPAKAKTINKILGSDYIVKASLGHIRDLPPKKLGVDIENNFQPEYELIASRKKAIKELQEIAKTADRIYLAPDPDREGEAIAWHLQAALTGRKKDSTDRFFRVTYNEITAPAIRKAFAQPTRINQNRVDAQQARRVLDRIVGYQVSPLLWRRIKGGSSAGRVQSVALRLICEREAEVRAFTSTEYWVFAARVNKRVPPPDPFIVRLAKINGQDPEILNEAQAGKVRQDLASRELVVSAIHEREVTRKTRPPFITSTLQQAGSSVFGFVPSRTMSLAQKLYEGVDFGDGSVGLITYMRTDSPAISKEAQDACRAFVQELLGAEYVPEKPNYFKGRSNAQEAHEAIRPTDVQRTPEAMAKFLQPDELKLYRLIWQRFVASQMASAKIAQRTVEFGAEGEAPVMPEMQYLFRVTASEILFPGFMKVTGEDRKKPKAEKSADADGEAEDVEALPPLQQGERVDCQEWLSEQKFTKPPARFSEASLVRTLEENGVGRPSTYAQIIQTLYARSYIEKEKGSLRPTEPGEKVNQFLVGHLNDLFNVDFTAAMEKELDEVEEGKLDWTQMMAAFYQNFLVWIQQAKGPDADQGAADQILALIETVQLWDAPTTRGKKTYSDQEFVSSMRKQLQEGQKPITMRQIEAVVRMTVKYRDQVPEAESRIRGIGFGELWDKANDPGQKPRESTLEKMQAMDQIQWDAPRQIGKKTYDDGEFFLSLKQQVEGGKRLSTNQLIYLDKLVQKYADQIQEFEKWSTEWGIQKEEPVPAEEIELLLKALSSVTVWKAPVKRGKREWSDEAFYKSLAEQFKAKKSLSPKQVSSLRKMASRYAGAGAG